MDNNYKSELWANKIIIKIMDNRSKIFYKYMQNWVSIVIVFLLFSCTAQEKKEAYNIVKRYGKLNADLERFYSAYQHDNKAIAAYFLLSNSPANFSFNSNNKLGEFYQNSFEYKTGQPYSSYSNYDITVLNCDSLIKTIDNSYAIWNKVPWSRRYSHNIFKEYILPYRIANEPLEYYWKWDLVNQFKDYNQPDTCIEKCINKINNNLGFTVDSKLSDGDFQSYSEMLANRVGTCDDRAILAVMALRSFGIPAAMEFVPYWGDTNNGHSFTTAILPDNSIYPLDGTNNVGHNFTFVHKATKVYRKMFSVQKNTLLYKNKDAAEIPAPFADFTLMDVTDRHSIGFADLKIEISKNISSKIIYLCVFSVDGWQPVAYAENNGYRTNFANVGTGTNRSRNSREFGANYGKGILYLPCIYRTGNFIPVSAPIIHRSDSNWYVRVDKNDTERVILARKYPLANRIKQFAEQMVGGIFQGANSPDFSDAETLYEIASIPVSHMQKAIVVNKAKYKYFRYIKPTGTFSIGEIKLYNEHDNQIKGDRIQADFLDEISELEYVFDGVPLTYFSMDKLLDAWVGLRFSNAQNISVIEYCPRTDDNDIAPGDTYELFYWDNSWVSLGEKRSTDFSISFDKVPKHALLWLRNKTKGIEERPFTYDNGEQTWW